jgi:hypothetical protein
MKLAIFTVAAAVTFGSVPANAGPHETQPSIQQLPTVQQLGHTRSTGFQCFRSFDRGVSAIRAGFTTEGLGCIQKAAAGGDVRAIRALGLMLLNGEYLGRNPEGATSYFYEAALRNDAQSMYLLGQAFARGIGVGTDQRLAGYWLGRAAANGYTPSAS